MCACLCVQRPWRRLSKVERLKETLISVCTHTHVHRDEHVWFLQIEYSSALRGPRWENNGKDCEARSGTRDRGRATEE